MDDPRNIEKETRQPPSSGDNGDAVLTNASEISRSSTSNESVSTSSEVEDEILQEDENEASLIMIVEETDDDDHDHHTEDTFVNDYNHLTDKETAPKKPGHPQQERYHQLRKKLWIYLIASIGLFLILMVTGIVLERTSASSYHNNNKNKKEKPLEEKEPSLLEETMARTDGPTETPTTDPSTKPSPTPTSAPSPTPPTMDPSPGPTSAPTTREPTALPSSTPTTEEPTSAPTGGPSASPTDFVNMTYIPGHLVKHQAGLLLSQGLAAREIASSGQPVLYANGASSSINFHILPDGAETFPDPRPENPNGWIYVSNSESPDKRKGGVGAITFDRHGNILDYKMVLEGTTMNCGGGGTPWNTWVSCEEVEFDGLIYQVDPTGERPGQVMTLGSAGGRWEAFAYDIRNRTAPQFFASEDHNKGTVRRFIPHPSTIDWENNPWEMLHGEGVTDYLVIHPIPGQDGGTFEWTDDIEAGRNNAREYYPQTEGIDAYGSQLFFVCKNIKQIFTVNLDDGTYTNASTANGLFDGKPDQMQRILDDPHGVLYFTEEGGRDAGVHARDATGNYYTILEGPDYNDETSGLAFSPDAMHLYIGFQFNGKIFDVWREDGLPFNARRLDVKYHGLGLGV